MSDKTKSKDKDQKPVETTPVGTPVICINGDVGISLAPGLAFDLSTGTISPSIGF